MSNFIIIFLSLFAGYAFAKYKIFPKDGAKTLNLFVIYVSVPAMVLLQVPKLQLDTNFFIPIFIAWTVMSICVAAVLLVCKYFNYSKSITGAMLLVAVLGNTSFVGIPVVSSYYGDDALGYVMVYDQFGSFIALSIYGSLIVSFYASTATFDLKQTIKKIVLFPPFVSLLIALLLMGASFPAEIQKVLHHLSLTIVPLALVAVGLQLKLKLPKPYLQPFSLALVIKLILAPLVAFMIVILFGFDSLSAKVSILESAMGPMITAAALASMSNLSPRLSSAIVGYGTILTIFTSALWYGLISFVL
jgi:hypothetical protein